MSGDLPKGWQAIRIGKFARERSERNKAGANIPVLSMTKHRGFVRASDYFSKAVHSENTDNYKVVRRGQFAYATIHLDEGSIDFLRAFEAGLISPMYTIFELTSDAADRDFVFRSLKRFALAGRFDPYSNGGVNRRKSIAFSNLKAFSFPMPPLAEQRAIADVLSAVEAAISKTEELIEALEDGRTEMTRAFQGGEDASKWPKKPIGTLLKQCQYGLSIPLDAEGSVPVLRMPDIDCGQVNVDVHALKATAVSAADIAACSIQEGDILFNRTNSQALVGKTGIVRKPPATSIVFASYLIRLVTKPGINPFWLNAVLNLPRVQERLKAHATPGVSQWNINSKTLKRFEISVPPKSEQDRFATLYEAIESRLQTERAKLAQTVVIRDAFAHELLSGRLRLPEGMIARHADTPDKAA
jgi:type I restriction enzyme S subunit